MSDDLRRLLLKDVPNPGEPGYDELLLEFVILAGRQEHRPEIPRELVVLVREVDRLRARVAELEAKIN